MGKEDSLVEGIRELVRRADLATACGQHRVAAELLMQASDQVSLFLKITVKEMKGDER